MRALLIKDGTVTSVKYNGTLKNMYGLLNCSMVAGVGYPDEHHAAWADDEILLQTPEYLVGKDVVLLDWYPELIVGPILVTGFDPETGDTKPATILIEDLKRQILTHSKLTYKDSTHD
jgi:hypothetical protein